MDVDQTNSMDLPESLLEQLKAYGVGRRHIDDILFINDKPPTRLGVYDVDEEYLYHEIIESRCTIPGCRFAAESLLDFENHYNSAHRYSCSQCKKVLPSPHLLDLHIQENHDSFFAVMAKKKPSYSCFIEECKEKFLNSDDRLEHCIRAHKLPKDFKFEQKAKSKIKLKTQIKNDNASMEVDEKDSNKKIFLLNSKRKTFTKYTGRKFTNTDRENNSSVNMDEVMGALKESLPQ